MNLTKEQLQRGFLGIILVIIALYAYSDMLLGPLGKKEAAAKKQIADLEPKIQKARSQLKRTQAIEAGDPNAQKASAARQAIDEAIPQKAPIVWLPQQVQDLLKTYDIENVSVSSRGALRDAELPNYSQTQWAVAIQSVSFHDFARALSGMENHFGLAQIQNFEIQATPASVEKHSASFNFTTPTRQ